MEIAAYIDKAFHHKHLLTMEDPEYRNWVFSFLFSILRSDKKDGDLTVSAILSYSTRQMSAIITAKEDGIIGGLEELMAFYTSQEITFTPKIEDGERITANTEVAHLTGPIRKLLETERLGLDLLGRISGIATKTNQIIAGMPKNVSTRIAATRKTLWGLLDKKGVALGGGLTHRLGLWQAVLIKDNHIMALKNMGYSDPFKDALYTSLPTLLSGKAAFFEIEVESMEETVSVAKNFLSLSAEKITRLNISGVPLVILLDNFTPDDIKNTVKSLSDMSFRHRLILEASGGISENNLMQYADTGVDIISMGYLTHSVRSLNFSQTLVKSL